MKKYSYLLAIIIVLQLCSFRAFASDRLEFFVDKNAQFGGNGSLNTPFNSIIEARDAVRELKKGGNYPTDGVIITVRGGLYNIDNTIEFTAEDSGSAESPVIYRAYPLEEVKLVGGTELSLSDFEISSQSELLDAVKGKIYCYNLKKNNIKPYDKLYLTGHSQYYFKLTNLLPGDSLSTPEVFYNDEVITISRYPNNGGYTKVGKVIESGDAICRQYQANDPKLPKTLEECTTMKFQVSEEITEERLKKWSEEKDAWLFGYWRYDWSDQTTAIRSINVADKTIETEYSSAFGVIEGQRYYIYNALSELDVPGEWYYDRINGNFYIYPLDNNPESKILMCFASDNIITLNGAENIQIRDMELAGTRTTGINVLNCKNITIFGNTVKNVSGNGIYVEGGKNVCIDSCHIYNVGGKGIHVDGGDYKTLEPSNHLVTNNWVNNFGRLNKTYCGALSLLGVGNVARNNLFYDGPHLAIQFSGNDLVIENNEIHSVLKEAADSGAIYTGRSTVKRGTIIRGNIIHGLVSDSALTGQYGIYLDDCQAGITVEQNLMYNIDGTAVFVNGGRDNTVANNTFVDIKENGIYFIAIGRALTWGYGINYLPNLGIEENGIHTTEPYKKYAHLSNITEDDPMSPKYNKFTDNIYCNIGKSLKLNPLVETGSNLTEAEMQKMNEINNGITLSKKDGFVDGDNENYNLADAEKVHKVMKGFKTSDYNKSGLITSMLKNELSTDAIALAIGKPSAYVNWKKVLIDSDNLKITPVIKDNNMYVPLRFLAEMLNADLNFENENIEINYEGNTLILKLNSSEALINSEAIELEQACYIENDKAFIPLSACSKLFNKQVFYDDKGLIIISEKDMTDVFDENMIINLINRLQ